MIASWILQITYKIDISIASTATVDLSEIPAQPQKYISCETQQKIE